MEKLTKDKRCGMECSAVLHIWEGGNWAEAWNQFCFLCQARETCNILKGKVEVVP